VKIIFLPDYNLEQAKLLVSGADIWLNTPQRPLEASGTSGMKAAHNGVPQLSTNDGWWPEGYVSGQTGWTITEKKDGANNLYDLLDKKILPLYYKQNKRWVALMVSTISLNASRFNTGRVLKQYIDQIYELKPVAIKKKG
jgi:starch phosphorylase